MKKIRSPALLLSFLLFASCRLWIFTPSPTPSPLPSATAVPPVPTATPTTAPSPTPLPTPAPALPTLAPLPVFGADSFTVRIHPDGGLFPGDQVSFEVIGPGEGDLENQEVSISPANGPPFGSASFGRFGIGGRQQATLQWVWDTTGLEAGVYPVVFDISPAGPVFTETVTLLPASLQGFPEPEADWAVAESDCCLLYYVTGTAAERDLAVLLETADTQADLAIAQLEGEFSEAITIVFLPRVLGHGGFAGSEIYISYLDRNYAGNAPGQVLHHEMIHILDGRKGGDLRPSIFVEGLAVLLSGGHFKKEAIVARAAAVLDLEAYIPLEELSSDFYFAQHEISYLEGAALIQFMIDTWGWEAFEAFYRGIQEHPSNLPAAAINQALQVNFDISLEELESQFLAYLGSRPEDPLAREDIRLSVLFYDTVRRYQLAMDPSAYFMTAWLIGIDQLLERGIVADVLRHPAAPANIALEAMLAAADRELRAGDYAAAGDTLAAVNAVLEAIENGDEEAFYADPLAGDTLALVLQTLGAGLEPQIILLGGDRAAVWGTRDSFERVELAFIKIGGEWLLDGR